VAKSAGQCSRRRKAAGRCEESAIFCGLESAEIGSRNENSFGLASQLISNEAWPGEINVAGWNDIIGYGYLLKLAAMQCVIAAKKIMTRNESNENNVSKKEMQYLFINDIENNIYTNWRPILKISKTDNESLAKYNRRKAISVTKRKHIRTARSLSLILQAKPKRLQRKAGVETSAAMKVNLADLSWLSSMKMFKPMKVMT